MLSYSAEPRRHNRARSALSTLLPFLSGLLAGALHVFGGPDVVGLAPFSVEAGRQAWRVGIRWGVGHALGSVVLGLLAYGVRDFVDLDLLSGSGEVLAGLLLVAIGVWGLWHLRRVDAPAAAVPAAQTSTHVHTTMAFGVGLAHGVFGTGTVLLVMPVLAMSKWSHALAFLAGYGLGAVSATVMAALAMGWAASRGGARVYRWSFGVVSGAALVVGVTWIGLAVAGVDLW